MPELHVAVAYSPETMWRTSVSGFLEIVQKTCQEGSGQHVYVAFLCRKSLQHAFSANHRGPRAPYCLENKLSFVRTAQRICKVLAKILHARCTVVHLLPVLWTLPSLMCKHCHEGAQEGLPSHNGLSSQNGHRAQDCLKNGRGNHNILKAPTAACSAQFPYSAAHAGKGGGSNPFVSEPLQVPVWEVQKRKSSLVLNLRPANKSQITRSQKPQSPCLPSILKRKA